MSDPTRPPTTDAGASGARERELLERRLAELEAQIAGARAELALILQSRGWRLVEAVRRLRRRCAPDGSRRERWLRLLMWLAGVARRDGPGAAWVWLRNKRRVRSLRAAAQPPNPSAYLAWLADHRLGEVDRETEAARAVEILLLTPATGAELEASVGSLVNQTHACWRLLVLGGNQNVAEDQRRDPEQGRVSSMTASSARVTELAGFDAVGLLGSGDRLAATALATVAQTLAEQPWLDAVYTDHDWGEPANGSSRDPLCKPEWSPDLLLSLPYALDVCLVRASALDRLGVRELGADRSCWWELLLRLAESGFRVGHVPAILCHRRLHEQGSAADRSQAAVGVLRAHLERSGLSATVEWADDLPRVRWSLPREPLVSIVIPTRDKVDVLARCIESIRGRTAYRSYELVVVDNRSEDPGTLAYLDELQRGGAGVVRWPHPFNWSAINNLAARSARGELLLFLNNDIEVLDAGWLGELVGWALRPQIGVVGGLLVRPDRTIQHAGVVLGLGGIAAHPFEGSTDEADGPAGRPVWYRNWLAVTGACQMVRRSVFDQLGGFDESFLALFSDVDFCVRAWRNGYRNVCTPFARMIHSHGTTRGGDVRMPPHDFVVAFERIGDVLERGDPYWSPLLSLDSSAPRLRPTVEPGRARWLGHLVDVLQERFPGDAARSPQVLAECGAEADRRMSLGLVTRGAPR